jgi:hypothetical protein
MGLLSEFEEEEKMNKVSRKEYKLRQVARLSEALKGKRNNNLLLYYMLKHEVAMIRAAQLVIPECLESINSVEERFRRRIVSIIYLNYLFSAIIIINYKLHLYEKA